MSLLSSFYRFILLQLSSSQDLILFKRIELVNVFKIKSPGCVSLSVFAFEDGGSDAGSQLQSAGAMPAEHPASFRGL